MEHALETDLTEVHRLLSLTNSALVRDRLHNLLDDLLQRKQDRLGGAISSHALPQQSPSAVALSMPPSSLHASGSAAPLAASELANGFARNVSLGSPNGAGQTAQGNSALGAAEANHLRRTRSLADTGDTQSTGSAGAIEPILSSAMVLANPQSLQQQQQDNNQHMALSSFDPVWLPGKADASSSEPLQSLDGLVTAQQLWQQAEAAGISFDGLGGFLGGSLTKSQQLGSGGSSGCNCAPVHGRLSGMGGAGRQQPPPPQHTQHSSLGMAGAAAQWMQQQQQPPGYPAVTAPSSQGLLACGHQQPPSYAAPKPMLHNLPGSFGSSAAQGYAGRLDPSRAPRGSGGLYGGSASNGGGGGGLYGGNFSSPYSGGGLPGAVHPSLQYGVDLRGGELDAMGMPLFRPLTTYSWEQSDGLVKIYVPLRGVQTDLLRATFALKSLEVRIVALQGKNYVYAVKSLFMPVNVDGCHVAASKTKKNVLITLQKLRSETPDERHWHDLTAP